MNEFLSSHNYPSSPPMQNDSLAAELASLLQQDFCGDMYALLAGYQRILADNRQRAKWPLTHKKLETLFMCGRCAPLNGPMIGIPVSIRDSDYFKETVRQLGKERSKIAAIEWMATAWNMTFADTGLWMGKTFEPVTREVVAGKTGHNRATLEGFDPASTRIGRNFFREPADPNIIQGLGLPVLTRLWNLQPRPVLAGERVFDTDLLEENRAKEINIPYSMTGGIFLADPGASVVPEMNGKKVYQLNYRWSALHPAYPMTRLIDEIVQIDLGIYLGQLVFATRHYSLGNLGLSFNSEENVELGEPYPSASETAYGYQNNGYFLMLDPAFAREVYADTAFPQLRPRPGESGYLELGYDKLKADRHVSRTGRKGWNDCEDWVNGWRHNEALHEKFTTFLLEDSPKESDRDDVRRLRQGDESILQMVQRISREISLQSAADDRLAHFEKLHRLFRHGIAPEVKDGSFRGHGKTGYNCRADGREQRDWHGVADVARGFDYYHGANLNLHHGLRDSLNFAGTTIFDDAQLFPVALAGVLAGEKIRGPNVLDMTWHSIGKYVFPWAGKSFEKISGRKLSMLLDESSDLADRYPKRAEELKTHLASAPHYALVKKAATQYWPDPGAWADHLRTGPWDGGMRSEDKAFWEKEAREHWVDGCNIQDKRIVKADLLFRLIDMNYRTPDPYLQALSEEGPAPFARQGYIFLGVSGRESVLAMNNGHARKKKVFQFHYRYPLIGGPAPIGLCLDELVEIADGLFLGQLIYATALDVPFHSSVDAGRYGYQLFGYFLLMDDAWQYHRQAIKLDVWHG